MTRAPSQLRTVATAVARSCEALGVPRAGDGIAVAVSGGADSLAALHALRTLAGPRRWKLAVLTVDHGLRAGSDADARFVADHARALGLPARVLTLAPADLARHRDHGTEGAARHARYEALRTAAVAAGIPWIATGHTKDDQAETVLLQLLRGAGPDGLAGMAALTGLRDLGLRDLGEVSPALRAGPSGPSVQAVQAVQAGQPGGPPGPSVWRPLLGVTRAQTRACCQAAGVAWRDDPTNADLSLLRNAVRARVLPLLEELRPGAVATLARTAELARDDRAWAEDAAESALTSLSVGGSGVAAPATGLAALPRGLARRVVRAAAARAGQAPPTAAATDEVLALARAGVPDGASAAWPGGRAHRAGDTVVWPAESGR